MIECTKCHEMRDEEQFSWRVKGVRRARQCKLCHKEYRRLHYQANREMYIAKAKKWSAENPGYGFRDPNYVRHGLTEEQYRDILAKQDYRCALCPRDEALQIDHDHACCPGPHSCGECVRGALCGRCNRMLGCAEDSVERLANAIAYLTSNGLGEMESRQPPNLKSGDRYL